MKKIIVGILFLVFIVSCGTKPENVVSKFITNIKEKKFEEASKYTLNKDFTHDLKLEYNNKTQQLLFETLFKNMNYKILGVEKNGKIYIVTVEVENVNTKKVFELAYQNLLKHTFIDNSSETSAEDEFKKVLESPQLPIKKNTTKFMLTKKGFKYKIDIDADNIDVLFGNINTTLGNLDTLGEDENQNDNNQTIQPEAPTIENNQKLVEPTNINKK